MRAYCTDYAPIRFEKVQNHGSHYDRDDESGPPSWERALRTRVQGMSKKEVEREVQRLDQLYDLQDMKATLSQALLRQLDVTNDALTQSDEDMANYIWTLVQLDQQVRELDPQTAMKHDRTKLVPQRSSRTKVYKANDKHSSSEVHKKKKKQYWERLSLTAYFRRAPRPHVDIKALYQARKKATENIHPAGVAAGTAPPPPPMLVGPAPAGRAGPPPTNFPGPHGAPPGNQPGRVDGGPRPQGPTIMPAPNIGPKKNVTKGDTGGGKGPPKGKPPYREDGSDRGSGTDSESEHGSSARSFSTSDSSSSFSRRGRDRNRHRSRSHARHSSRHFGVASPNRSPRRRHTRYEAQYVESGPRITLGPPPPLPALLPPPPTQGEIDKMRDDAYHAGRADERYRRGSSPLPYGRLSGSDLDRLQEDAYIQGVYDRMAEERALEGRPRARPLPPPPRHFVRTIEPPPTRPPLPRRGVRDLHRLTYVTDDELSPRSPLSPLERLSLSEDTDYERVPPPPRSRYDSYDDEDDGYVRVEITERPYHRRRVYAAAPAPRRADQPYVMEFESQATRNPFAPAPPQLRHGRSWERRH